MPEGHSIHRIAKQFNRDFASQQVQVSSPQGRFTAGAELLDGQTFIDAKAVGKQLFIEFTAGHHLRVHLGIYGAWSVYYSQGRATTLGAPRVLRLGEEEEEGKTSGLNFPPPIIGTVRVRIVSEETVADLRGPTVCEVITATEVQRHIDRLGPDAALDPEGGLEEFARRLSTRSIPIAQALMDQNIIAGIGNIYRAELLFRAGISPFIPSKKLSSHEVETLWQDWTGLLADGIRDGVIITREDLSVEQREAAFDDRSLRNWVYQRHGQACLRCGTEIRLQDLAARKLYWCPVCQPA